MEYLLWKVFCFDDFMFLGGCELQNLIILLIEEGFDCSFWFELKGINLILMILEGFGSKIF